MAAGGVCVQAVLARARGPSSQGNTQQADQPPRHTRVTTMSAANLAAEGEAAHSFAETFSPLWEAVFLKYAGAADQRISAAQMQYIVGHAYGVAAVAELQRQPLMMRGGGDVGQGPGPSTISLDDFFGFVLELRNIPSTQSARDALAQTLRAAHDVWVVSAPTPPSLPSKRGLFPAGRDGVGGSSLAG